MKPPVAEKKTRRTVEKQHYWLQIDFEIRAETLETAIARMAHLFRGRYRKVVKEGQVYMGAHSATVRGRLSPGPRTMHPTIQLKKGTPIRPGVTLAELDAEEAARRQQTDAKAKPKEKAENPLDILGDAEEDSKPDGTVTVKLPFDGKPTEQAVGRAVRHPEPEQPRPVSEKRTRISSKPKASLRGMFGR